MSGPCTDVPDYDGRSHTATLALASRSHHLVPMTGTSARPTLAFLVPSLARAYTLFSHSIVSTFTDAPATLRMQASSATANSNRRVRVFLSVLLHLSIWSDRVRLKADLRERRREAEYEMCSSEGARARGAGEWGQEWIQVGGMAWGEIDYWCAELHRGRSRERGRGKIKRERTLFKRHTGGGRACVHARARERGGAQSGAG